MRHRFETNTPSTTPTDKRRQWWALPSVEYGGIILHASCSNERDLSVVLEFLAPGGLPPSIMYPLEPYARIAEFTAMLAHPLTAEFSSMWLGTYFTAVAQGQGPDEYIWRCRISRLGCNVSADQWHTMGALFDLAFSTPEYQGPWTGAAKRLGDA